MNTSPRLHGKVIDSRMLTCGTSALRNDAAAFWQSRMTTAGRRAPLPQLIDIERFARGLTHVAAPTLAAPTLAAFTRATRLAIDDTARCARTGRPVDRSCVATAHCQGRRLDSERTDRCAGAGGSDADAETAP